MTLITLQVNLMTTTIRKILLAHERSHKHSNLSNKPLILIAPLGYFDEGHFVEIRETHTKMWETLLESKWWSIYFRGKKFNMV